MACEHCLETRSDDWRWINISQLTIIVSGQKLMIFKLVMFKLTERRFALLTHCWFYHSVVQITYDVTYDI